MKRSAMPARKKPMSRGSGPKSKGRKSRPKPSPNEFPEESRQEMRRRSGGICEVGGPDCTGRATQFHHRKLKRHKDQRSVNGLHVCSPDHTWIHNNVAVSQGLGWLVPEWLDPAIVPVKPGERYAEVRRPQP